MMDIKYDFKANPFKEKDGKPVLYPAVVVKETITTDHIVKELSKHSAYSAGCVVGVLQEVADMVVSHLRQGKNVRLDGLGTFSLALSSREVTDRKEIRAASVRIKKVNFRPVPELVKRVRQETDILRAEFGFLPTVKKRSKEERWTLLEAYLKEHGSITRLAYSEWLGVARTTAAYELKAWYEEKRLDKEGKHSHAVYVLRRQEGIAEVSPLYYPFGNKKRGKVVVAALFIHKKMCCHHPLKRLVHGGSSRVGGSSGSTFIKLRRRRDCLYLYSI